LGGLLIMSGGYTLLFATLTGLALAVAGWAALAIPTVPALPRARQTVLDLARRLGSAGFLRPTITLAGATAAPGRRRGIPPGRRRSCRDDATGHRRRGVTLLAGGGVLVQPWAGGPATPADHCSSAPSPRP